MKHKNLSSAALTLFIILSTTPVRAFELHGGVFDVGTKTYVCSDNTFLLSAPDRKQHSKKLPLGEAVKILEQSSKSETVRTLQENFYKVKSSDSEGFIWGGDLAKAYVALDASTSPDLLLIKLDGGTADYPNHVLIAEVVRAGKILSRCHFRGIETVDGRNYRYSLKLSQINEPFSGQPKLFKLNQDLQACDYACGDSFLVLLGTNIRHAMEAVSIVDEQGGTQYKIIGPAERGGLKDRLTIVYTTSVNETKQKSVRRETYFWNGKFFVPPRRSKDYEPSDQPPGVTAANGGSF